MHVATWTYLTITHWTEAELDMAPIKFKEVVTYSSQDGNHRAENLLKAQTQWNRWLCSLDDKSGCIQVEIQLERAEDIGFIDIGNYGSSTVEIQVRRCYDAGFKALLPATMFRTIEESRQGRNKNGVRMFTKDHFVEGVRDQKWDTVKIICRELSRKVNQFGLAFVSFSSVQQNDVRKFDPSLVAKSQEAVVARKDKQLKRSSNVVPAWKKDAAFYRQYLERNINRSLKMSPMAEEGTRNEESFGRSAKMLLAASSNTKLNEVTNYQPTGSTTPVNEVKDGLVQFRRKLQNFIRKEGEEMANASMKGLRTKFEEQLGYKMDKTKKAEFKVALLRAAKCLVSSKKSPAKGVTMRQPSDCKVTPEQKQSQINKAGTTKRKIFTEKKTQSVTAATTAYGTAATSSVSSKKSPMKGVTMKRPGDCKETPKQKQLKTSKAGTTKKKCTEKKTKSLPASAYRNCPRCCGKFTANQINLHIANCTPDHKQIARAALGDIINISIPSAVSSPPATTCKEKGPIGKQKKAPADKQKKAPTMKRASGQNNQKRCSIDSSSTSINELANQSAAGTSRNNSSKVTNSLLQFNSQDYVHSWAASPAQPFNKNLIQCPICCDSFDMDFIEIHASSCGIYY